MHEMRPLWPQQSSVLLPGLLVFRGYAASFPRVLACRIATTLVTVFLISLQQSSFNIVHCLSFPLRNKSKYWLWTTSNSKSVYTTYSGGWFCHCWHVLGWTSGAGWVTLHLLMECCHGLQPWDSHTIVIRNKH